MTESAASVDEPRLVGSDRVLAVLSLLATLPAGASLDEMARTSGQPKASVHRALGALVRSGYAMRDGRGHYVLGDEFLRLAFTHHEARPEHLRVGPALRALTERFSETAHYAVLDGRDVVYRAKADPPTGAVRLSSAVGGRNPAHCTAIGKVLLAALLPDRDAVRRWVGDASLERRTERSAIDAEHLTDLLAETRDRGFGIDDQENEPGVNCIAMPVHFESPDQPSGAVSVSALAYRTPLATLVEAADEVRAILAETLGLATVPA